MSEAKVYELFHACRKGDLDVIFWILSCHPSSIHARAPANGNGGFGDFPLHVACQCGDADVVSLLLAANANLHAQDEVFFLFVLFVLLLSFFHRVLLIHWDFFDRFVFQIPNSHP